MQRRLSFILLSSFFLAGIAGAGESVKIEGVPHVRQKPDFCGEACVAMWLRKQGQTVDQDWVFDQAGLDPHKGRGAYTREMITALKAIGFDPGRVGYTIRASAAKKELAKQWQALYKDLQAGVPSIICMHYNDKPKTTEHFRLILGYDADEDEVLYHEPAGDDGAYRRMKRDQLLKLWPLKYKASAWTVIRMPLRSAGKLKQGRVSKTFTNADFAQHVRKLKLPPGKFHVIIEPPFVVIGDESEAMVKRRAERTVRWATKHLKALYFKNDPESIYNVWLFKNKTSYEKNAKLLFGEEPGTPFGYCSSAHKALVMNIATGGGTLVHEMVHAFMDNNFEACPSWFNEGMGSLYEQCGTREGRIVGFTNWRLRGLQKAIRDKRLPTFEKLSSTTTWQFYNMDRGDNYGQARYLCYYLQEKGKLVPYYKQFIKNVDKDPTGYKTLKAILGRDDMDAFQKEWEGWVMKLRFR